MRELAVLGGDRRSRALVARMVAGALVLWLAVPALWLLVAAGAVAPGGGPLLAAVLAWALLAGSL